MSTLGIVRNLPVDVVGYFAALLMIGAFAMRTMIPLRLWGIGASSVLVVFGYLSRSYPILILHLVLLPVNGLRLYQMLHFTRGIKEASRGDPDVNWLKPFMSSRQIARGAVLFRKGDPASELFYIVSGRFHISETDIERGPGALIGELGFLVPDDRRTATLECMDEAVVLRISYEQMTQLYFENPNFGFYLMRLASQRLLREIARLESEAAIRASAAATAAT